MKLENTFIRFQIFQSPLSSFLKGLNTPITEEVAVYAYRVVGLMEIVRKLLKGITISYDVAEDIFHKALLMISSDPLVLTVDGENGKTPVLINEIIFAIEKIVLIDKTISSKERDNLKSDLIKLFAVRW